MNNYSPLITENTDPERGTRESLIPIGEALPIEENQISCCECILGIIIFPIFIIPHLMALSARIYYIEENEWSIKKKFPSEVRDCVPREPAIELMKKYFCWFFGMSHLCFLTIRIIFFPFALLGYICSFIFEPTRDIKENYFWFFEIYTLNLIYVLFYLIFSPLITIGTIKWWILWLFWKKDNWKVDMIITEGLNAIVQFPFIPFYLTGRLVLYPFFKQSPPPSDSIRLSIGNIRGSPPILVAEEITDSKTHCPHFIITCLYGLQYFIFPSIWVTISFLKECSLDIIIIIAGAIFVVQFLFAIYSDGINIDIKVKNTIFNCYLFIFDISCKVYNNITNAIIVIYNKIINVVDKVF